MAGFDVLTALRLSGAPYRLTAGQLAVSGLISSAGVMLRLDRLENDGLLVRERDAGARHVVCSRLTEPGSKKVPLPSSCLRPVLAGTAKPAPQAQRCVSAT